MQCTKHPEHVAEGMCSYSGKPFCSHELVEVDGRYYAKDNVGKVLAEAKQAASRAPAVFMNAGGAAASASAAANSVPIAVRKPINHALHIVLTVLSAGLWLPVYLVILLARSC